MWAWWDGRDKKVGFAEKKLRLWVLAWAAAWVWALEGRAQNIAPLQVGGIVAVVAVDAIEAIGVRRGTFGGRRVFWARGRVRVRARGLELVCWMGV